jgi:hypothetical protein
MPNGFQGSNHDWNRMERPLLKIDPTLASFASLHHLSESANYHNWPERSLVWSSDGIRKLIQVYLEDAKDLTLNLWISASEDRGSERFWKQQFLRKAVPLHELERDLPQLLSNAKETLDSWSGSDLERATTLKGNRT